MTPEDKKRKYEERSAATRKLREERLQAKSLRNKQMMAEAINGAQGIELADKYGLTPEHTSVIMNHTKDAEDVAREVTVKFQGMIDDAVTAISEVLNNTHMDNNSNRLKAAQMVLERTVGKVIEKLETKNLNMTLTSDELLSKVKQKIEEIEKKQ